MVEYIVNKNGWLWLAPQYFNQWRVFPRAFVIFYFWLCMETALWFMGLPNPSTAQAAFASAIISAGAAWFGLYVNSGPNRQTNVVVQSTPQPEYNAPTTEATPKTNLDNEGPKG